MRKFFFSKLKPMIGMIGLIIILSTISTAIMTAKPIILAGLMNNALSAMGFSELGENDSQSEYSPEEEIFSLSNIFDLNKVSDLANRTLEYYEISNLGKFELILFFVFLLVSVSVLANITKFFADVLNNYTRNKVLAKVRSDITDKLLTFGLSFFSKQKVGDVSSRIVEDSKAFAQGVVSVPHRIFETGLLIIIYSTYLFITSFSLAFYILIIFVMHYILSQFIKNPVRKTQQKTFDQTATLNANLQETFSSTRIIKSFAREKFVLNKIAKNIIDSSKSLFRAQNVIVFQAQSRQVLDALAEGMVIIVAINQLFSESISLEGFILFLYVSRLLMPPISEISTQIVWISGIRASFNRIGQYLSLNPNVISGEIVKKQFEKSLEIKNISFSYHSSKVLENINISIKKGEVVAIVGPSGSGKSTLLDLVLRLYDVENGELNIDGHNIKNLSISHYRHIFGVVPQEPFLFNDTIINNIKFGREHLTNDQVYDAAKIANAHSFIMETESGYETLLGDRGVRLSGGQKQRISIARAIVGKPQILIFDEATSALDTDSEKQVQDAIERVLKDSTAIIVAHRLSTVINANKILVLSNGKVEAVGNHHYLLQESSTYKRLCQLQELK